MPTLSAIASQSRIGSDWQRLTVATAIAVVVATTVTHPQASPSAQIDDASYYNFWAGSWHRVDGGKTDPEPSFVVAPGVNNSAFDESWRLRGDKDEVLISRAMRVWDASTRRWMLAWINREGIFQVWEGRKVGTNWYIYREFEQDGRRFWSRQAWIPSGPTQVVRVMERSFDDRATWELRSRTTFVRRP